MKSDMTVMRCYIYTDENYFFGDISFTVETGNDLLTYLIVV